MKYSCGPKSLRAPDKRLYIFAKSPKITTSQFSQSSPSASLQHSIQHQKCESFFAHFMHIIPQLLPLMKEFAQ